MNLQRTPNAFNIQYASIFWLFLGSCVSSEFAKDAKCIVVRYFMSILVLNHIDGDMRADCFA